jgi:hypothetical protein
LLSKARKRAKILKLKEITHEQHVLEARKHKTKKTTTSTKERERIKYN